jgi:hypothetical protein
MEPAFDDRSGANAPPARERQDFEELLDELRPVARHLAVALVRSELDRLAMALLDPERVEDVVSGNGHLGPPRKGLSEDDATSVEATERPEGTPGYPQPSKALRSKTCSKCRRTLSLRNFEKGRGQCRQCRADYNRENAARRKRIAAASNGSGEDEPSGPADVDSAEPTSRRPPAA